MITIITNVIIVQIDKFLKNSFNLLLLDKKPGKIKTKTAIRKIADIIWSVLIYFMNFSKIS